MKNTPPDPIPVIVPVGKPVYYKTCPVGLFRFDGQYGLMTDYANAASGREAYVVASGEVFWGGADSPEARALLKVQPCQIRKFS